MLLLRSLQWEAPLLDKHKKNSLQTAHGWIPLCNFEEKMPHVMVWWYNIIIITIKEASFPPPHPVETTYALTYRVPWMSWSWYWPVQSGWQLGSSFRLFLVWRRNILSGPRDQRLWDQSWGREACSFEPIFLPAGVPVAFKKKTNCLRILFIVCNRENFFECLTVQRPWMGGWSHWVVQKSRRRWSSQLRVVVEEWVGRGGCRSGHCLLHGSSYSSHPEARKCGQTHLGLKKL